VDVVFYVLRGEGVIEIGNEKEVVETNTLIESPKDIVHCWYNESDEELAFMVIKVPRPDRETKFISE
jgi:mannose-6-phosphate isomerase-like protein (cupin superfamily)